jgi:hypothetical protein
MPGADVSAQSYNRKKIHYTGSDFHLFLGKYPLIMWNSVADPGCFIPDPSICSSRILVLCKKG